MCGPNTCPDYITLEGMSYLFDNSFKIQLSSNRSAYRLEEIQINNFFARKDGGEGGAHPFNIIDHAYGMPGALNICGNTPVLLAVDGPTLGGYICVFTIIKSDLWKLGQGTPGRDYIKFINLSRQEAVEEWRKFKSLFLENSFE
jgi:allophanate hydrolase subunit 2